MKDLIVFAVLTLLTFSARTEVDIAITEDFAQSLKAEGVTWEVVGYKDNLFRGWTVDELKGFLQTKKEPEVWLTKGLLQDEVPADLKLPANFDCREKWGKCIHPIRNQGHCGSCWAHGASETLSDRFCIGGHDVIISPQDLVSCDPHDHGCNGGGDITPFLYMTQPGAVSDTCFPYVSGNGEVPPCISKCVNNEPYIKYRCAAGSMVIKSVVASQQEEMYNHGPMNTAFSVYKDFMYYRSGIYYHKSGEFLGGHAIKVVGWGVQDGLQYWVCANSWGPSWGEQGFFRIKMGDCGIMDRGVACTPAL